MLNGSDVQLFYKLLDSLSTSLRDLAVKYELLLRESTEREKVATAVTSIAKEISGTFASMSKDIDLLKEFATESEQNEAAILSSVQANIKNIEMLDAKAGQILRDIGTVSTGVSEANAGVRHVDDHMDATGRQIGELLGISQKMTAMIGAVEEMKKDFTPIKKLSLLMSKPVAMILGVYFIVTTILAVMKGCDEFNDARKGIGGQGNTNPVPAAAVSP
jgi:methyl-accepting chemotaxis protein